MKNLAKLHISKATSLFLIMLLFTGDLGISGLENTAIPLPSALEDYRAGKYREALDRLEPFLESIKEYSPAQRGRFYLLLGACCDKLGRGEPAKRHFSELKRMVDGGMLLAVPELKGVDADAMLSYRAVFTTDAPLFSYKEPVPVSRMLENKVIYPSKMKKLEEKRKKRFPWILVAVGAAAAAGVAVLLLSQKEEDKPEFPEIPWVSIPAGKFQMGDPFAEGDNDERPMHTVYLDGYKISRYEITYEQFSYFCTETGADLISDNYRNILLGRCGYPVSGISWQDAEAFCRWLSMKEGKNIHLPTEAQWEKAARGGHPYRYPWGDSPPDCNKANYFGCGTIENYRSNIGPVYGQAEGYSPFGIPCMAGNVREWCRDWYGAGYYAISVASNPTGPTSGTHKVIRGGGVASMAHQLRCADRDSAPPDFVDLDLGFRVVMED